MNTEDRSATILAEDGSDREPIEIGPNGNPTGFLKNGDKVEWMPDDDGEGIYPMLVTRNLGVVIAAMDEFFDQIWWNRHQSWLDQVYSGEEVLTDDRKEIFKTARAEAKKVEEKYGLENLQWTDFEWGMLNGKLSALRWVTGAEWDFLDT